MHMDYHSRHLPEVPPSSRDDFVPQLTFSVYTESQEKVLLPSAICIHYRVQFNYKNAVHWAKKAMRITCRACTDFRLMIIYLFIFKLTSAFLN